MNSETKHLRAEIQRLKEDLADREASLPVHSVRAHQLMAIEALEEEIRRKEDALKSLDAGSREDANQAL